MLFKSPLTAKSASLWTLYGFACLTTLRFLEDKNDHASVPTGTDSAARFRTFPFHHPAAVLLCADAAAADSGAAARPGPAVRPGAPGGIWNPVSHDSRGRACPQSPLGYRRSLRIRWGGH